MNELVLADRAADSRRLKTLVLDSVSSPITRRVYNMALDEFLAWFQQAPRPGFTKATVSAWRVSLEAGARVVVDHRPDVGDSQAGGGGCRQRAAGARTGRRDQRVSRAPKRKASAPGTGCRSGRRRLC